MGRPSNGRKTAGRDPRTGRFVAGNSGGGRKEIPEDIKTMLQGATPDACRLLCDTINDPDVKLELRIKCAEIVLDRVYGRPALSVDVQACNVEPVIFVGCDEVMD